MGTTFKGKTLNRVYFRNVNVIIIVIHDQTFLKSITGYIIIALNTNNPTAYIRKAGQHEMAFLMQQPSSIPKHVVEFN